MSRAHKPPARRARQRAVTQQLRPVRADAGGFVGLVREPSSGAWQRNQEITTKTALSSSGVYSCIITIADDVSKMQVMARQKDANGIRNWREDHWASRLFHKPNSFQTSLQFLQQYVVSKLLTGNVFVYFTRDDRNVPNNMFILDARSVTPFVSDAGEVFYQVSTSGGNTNAVATLDESQPLIPATEILHDRMVTVFHPLLGVSPMFAAAASAQAGNSIIENAKAFFGNMARASGVLTAPGKVGKETAQRLADTWQRNFSRGNIGQVAVLGDGLKWEPLIMSAADAQLIDILRWTIEDVARCFRVPSYMLGDLSKVSYKSTEQLQRTYYASPIQWHLESIEQAFDKYFDFGPSMQMEFDLETMFRTEIDTRFGAYQTGINAGVFSINEVRAKENLAPVKGGEEPRVQMQYVPLSQALEPPEPEPEPEAEPPTEDEEEQPPEEQDEETERDEEERHLRHQLARHDVLSRIRGLTYARP